MKTFYLLLLSMFYLTPSFSLNPDYKSVKVDLDDFDKTLEEPCALADIMVVNVSVTNSLFGTTYNATFTVDGVQYWVTFNPQTGVINTNYNGTITGGGGLNDPFIIIEALNPCGPAMDTLNFNDALNPPQNDPNNDPNDPNSDPNNPFSNPTQNGGLGTPGTGGPNINAPGGGNTNGTPPGNGGGPNTTGGPGTVGGPGSVGSVTGNGGPCQNTILNESTVSMTNTFTSTIYTIHFSVNGMMYWSNYNETTGQFDSNYPYFNGYTNNNGDSYVVIEIINQCGTFLDTVYLVSAPNLSGSSYQTNGGALSPPQVNAEKINLYPNPSVESIFINYPIQEEETEVSFQLMNKNGEVKLSTLLTESSQKIDVLTLQPGVYYYHIISDGQMVKSGKLMIN